MRYTYSSDEEIQGMSDVDETDGGDDDNPWYQEDTLILEYNQSRNVRRQM